MIREYFIEEFASIWKIHFDIESSNLYVELRYDKEFELKSILDKRSYKTPLYNNYVQNILSVQYPYVVISYRPIENLLEDQIIVLYNLELDKEEWISSEFRVEEVFNQSLKVYHPKILPKSTYFINFKKEQIEHEQTFTKSLNLLFAENSQDSIVIKESNKIFHYSVENSLVSIFENNELIYSDELILEESYNKEYDYMLKMNNYLIFLMGKHKMKLYEV